MKINRYLYGTTNVEETKSAQGRLMSPGQAGELAAGPYKAFAKAGQQITQDLVRIDARDKQLRAQEAAQTAKIAALQQKAGIASIVNDPSNKDQMQPDGTPTASKMLEEYEEVAASVRERVESIEDPRIRENALEVLEMEQNVDRMNIRNEVNSRREAWNARGEFDLLEIMIEGQDYDAAQIQLNSMVESGQITEPQYRQFKGVIEKEEMQFESDQMLDDWELKRASGKGDEYYNDLVNNQDMDPELKQLTISKIENQQTNYEAIRQKAIAKQKAGWLRRKTNMKMAIINGQPLPESIDSLVADMAGSGDDAMALRAEQYRAELLLTKANTVKGDVKYQTYLGERNAVGYVNDTPANRGFLDREIQESFTPEMTPEERLSHELDVMNDANMLSQKFHEMYTNGVGDPQRLGQSAQLWDLQMMQEDNPQQIRTTVTEEAQALLVDTALRIRAGVDPTVAADEAIRLAELKNDNPQEYQSRNAEWSTKNNRESFWSDEAGKPLSYSHLEDLHGDHYDNSPWLPIGQSADLSPQDYVRYENYMYNAFMQSRNWDTAKETADMRFKQSHAMTNINGRWEVQYNGMPGDVEHYRKTFVEDNKDTQYMIADDEGNYTIGTMSDLDEVYYQNPQMRGGEYTYEVLYKGRPVMQKITDPETKKETLGQVYDRIGMAEVGDQKLNEFVKNTQEQIDDLREDLLTAERMQNNIYVGEESRQKLREIPNKIKRLEGEIEKERARISGQYGTAQ